LFLIVKRLACSDSLSGVFRNKLECWPRANICKYGRCLTYKSTFTHSNKSYVKSQTRVEMVESKLVRSVKDFFSFNKLLYASYLPTSGRTEDNLKVVWTEFSTLSWAVLLLWVYCMAYIDLPTSRVAMQ